MDCTVQQIFTQHFGHYARSHNLPPHYYKAANKLSACRTAILGGHHQVCENGHHAGIWYNSCRHRSCPQCQFIQAERWLDNQKARLINTAHRHVVFTIPHELHDLWRHHTALMIDVLFRAVRQTLQTFCRDATHLGAEPGFVCTLHTWGRSLSLHPHIHCLIAEGGLDDRGQWRTPKRTCFLPARPLMHYFRGRYLTLVRESMARGELILPPDLWPNRLLSRLNKLGRKKWNVRVMERYAHGTGVATYLARYVRGGPLNNTQLRWHTTGDIVFHYHAHHDGGTRRTQRVMSPELFIDVYLAHIPPPNKPLVRAYGLYANTQGKRLEQARTQCGQGPVETSTPVDWPTALARCHVLPRCQECGGPLRLQQSIAPVCPWKRRAGRSAG